MAPEAQLYYVDAETAERLASIGVPVEPHGIVYAFMANPTAAWQLSRGIGFSDLEGRLDAPPPEVQFKRVITPQEVPWHEMPFSRRSLLKGVAGAASVWTAAKLAAVGGLAATVTALAGCTTAPPENKPHNLLPISNIQFIPEYSHAYVDPETGENKKVSGKYIFTVMQLSEDLSAADITMDIYDAQSKRVMSGKAEAQQERLAGSGGKRPYYYDITPVEGLKFSSHGIDFYNKSYLIIIKIKMSNSDTTLEIRTAPARFGRIETASGSADSFKARFSGGADVSDVNTETISWAHKLRTRSGTVVAQKDGLASGSASTTSTVDASLTRKEEYSLEIICNWKGSDVEGKAGIARSSIKVPFVVP